MLLRIRRASWAALATFYAALSAADTSAQKPEFSPGQVWTFQLDTTEPAATLTVLEVETLEGVGEVVFISVSATRMPSGIVKNLHFPMAREALERSVVSLLRMDEVTFDPRQYETWKRLSGYVYTTSVSEAMAFVRKSEGSGERPNKSLERTREG
jgi:hypothetical protein